MKITPVIQRPYGAEKFWLALPKQPWPSFIELSGETSDADVVLIVYQLCTYGADAEEPLTSSALVSAFPDALPGGLAASEGEVEIYPGCCCGLEEWTTWMKLIETGDTPWLGHDPWPWIEFVDGNVTIWADGGAGEFDRQTTPHIVTTIDALNSQLERIEPTLRGFAERLKSVLRRADVAEADAIAAGFIAAFVAPPV